MGLIMLKEYAERIGKDRSYLIRKAAAGHFKTARKIGRAWFIDENETYTDMRIKNGSHIGEFTRYAENRKRKQQAARKSNDDDID